MRLQGAVVEGDSDGRPGRGLLGEEGGFQASLGRPRGGKAPPGAGFCWSGGDPDVVRAAEETGFNRWKTKTTAGGVSVLSSRVVFLLTLLLLTSVCEGPSGGSGSVLNASGVISLNSFLSISLCGKGCYLRWAGVGR